MSNALPQMMVPRLATPEHLRLKPPASSYANANVVASHLKASTTEALTVMYRSVIEKGHAMQIVDSPAPCWVRKGAATAAEANRRVWLLATAKFDKAQFRDQPFSISVRAQAGGAIRRRSSAHIFARWQVVPSWVTWSSRVHTTTHLATTATPSTASMTPSASCHYQQQQQQAIITHPPQQQQQSPAPQSLSSRRRSGASGGSWQQQRRL